MVDYKKYEPFFGSWFVTKQIGEGSYGQVFEIEKRGKVKAKPSALKIIQIPHSPEDAKIRLAEGADPELLSEYYDSVLRELVREIEIMDELKGITNIVSMEDFEVKPHEDGIGYDLLITTRAISLFLTGEIITWGISALPEPCPMPILFCRRKAHTITWRRRFTWGIRTTI